MSRSACHVCGAELPAASRWCGSCGAAVVGDVAGEGDPSDDGGAGALPSSDEAVDDVVRFAPSDAPIAIEAGQPDESSSERSMPRRRRQGRLLAGAVVLFAVAVGVTTGFAPDDPSTDRIGEAGLRTGLTSTWTPPDDLEVAWRIDAAPRRRVAPPPPVRLDGDAVIVGDVVVDVATGDAVGAAPPGAVVAGAAAVVEGDELLLVDAATGAVTERLPLSVDGATPVGAALLWADDDPVLRTTRGGAVRIDLASGTAVWTTDETVAEVVPGDVLPLADGRVLDTATGRIDAARSEGDLVAATDALLLGRSDDRRFLQAVARDGGAGWLLDVAPGRVEAVDPLDDGFLAVHVTEFVVSEVHRVDPTTGAIVATVAGWPPTNGRATHATADGVAGVVGEVVRRFEWDGTERSTVLVGDADWVVSGAGDLLAVQRVRGDDLLLVDTAAGVVRARVRGVAPVPPQPAVVGVGADAVAVTSPGSAPTWLRLSDGGTRLAPEGAPDAASALPVLLDGELLRWTGARDGVPTLYDPGPPLTLDGAVAGTLATPFGPVASTGAGMQLWSWQGLPRWAVPGRAPLAAAGDVVLAGPADAPLTRRWTLHGPGGVVITEVPPGTDIVGPLPGGDVLIVTRGSVTRREPDTGRVVWRRELPVSTVRVSTSQADRYVPTAPDAVVLGDVVVVATADLGLLAIRIVDGRETWRTSVGRVTAWTVAGDTLVVGTADREVVLLGTGGRRRGAVVLPSAARWLAAAGETIVALTDDGTVGLGAAGRAVVDVGAPAPGSRPGRS